MRFGILRRPADEAESNNNSSDDNSSSDFLGSEHYGKVEEQLGYKFKDISWLGRAFTHRSSPTLDRNNDYERLEFVGDAVFDLAVAHLLSEIYPEAKEGELSKMRAALVNTKALSTIAKRIGLAPFIKLGKGEASSGGSDRPSILADVMEAVIGAVYKDSGYYEAFKCIEIVYGDELKTVTPRDPKTELQEALHASGSQPPEYLLECMEGPEHAPTFVSVVQVDGQIVGRGRGPTKKASQQEAASQALDKLKTRDEIDSVFLPQQASAPVAEAVTSDHKEEGSK